MIECSMNEITKYYGANKIFENISFDLKTGERIGLIGQNGCGKSTILKILMGKEDIQQGEVSFRKNARVGYLEQMVEFEKGIKVIDILESAFEQGYLLKMEMRRISKIAKGLCFSEDFLEMAFDALSGGEKTKVVLAKLLLEEPDILLLDEPSNHLDVQSIEWLEEFLKNYGGSMIVVSHDRYFLDVVATKIIELELTRAVPYLGNYSYYVIEKERRFLIDYSHYQNQQKKIEQMERQIERYRIWGVMRDSDKMFVRAKELEKRLEKIEVLDQPKIENRRLRLSNGIEKRSGKIVLKVNGLSKEFGQKRIFEEVSFELYYGESACILGGNGCGKTTLLKIVLDEIGQTQGTFQLGASLKIGYLPQSVQFENEELTIVEYFSSKYSLGLGEARSELAKVLFMKDDVNKKLKSLSGGEKSRLKLCGLSYEKVNLMILDEPTNHLDIDSREVLEENLMSFEGTILFVSHDRYFIRKIADKILNFEQGSLQVYSFAYDVYLEEIHKKTKAHTELMKKSDLTSNALKNNGLQDALKNNGLQEAQKNNRQKNEQKDPQNDSQKNSGQKDEQKHNQKKPSQFLNRKIASLEKEIGEIEVELRLIEEKMNQMASEAQMLEQLFSEKNELQILLDGKFKQWEDLQEGDHE